MQYDRFENAVITLGIFAAAEEYFSVQFMDTEIQEVKTIDELVELIKLKQID